MDKLFNVLTWQRLHDRNTYKANILKGIYEITGAIANIPVS